MERSQLLGDRYTLDRAVGAGGMGQVHAGVDTVLGRDVAIKTVSVKGAGDTALERFRREAMTAASLHHPNVVTIFDTGVDGDTAFLVMELLPGPDLAAHVAQRGPLPEAEAVALAAQAAAGLAAAHDAGIVHRDIKPANLVFAADGTLRIVDFGIARLEHAGLPDLTATATVIGSAHYLSPEQVEGRPADARSDLYALGCVLTTMLLGRPPFEAEHPMGVAHQHLTAVAPGLATQRPDVSPELAGLVDQLLSKSPEHRPQTAHDVVNRLRSGAAAGGATQLLPAGAGATQVQPPAAGATQVLSPGAGATQVMPAVAPRVQPLPPTTAQPAVPAGAPTPPTNPPNPTPPRRRRLKKLPVALLALAAIALVAILANALGGDDSQSPAAASPSVTRSTTPIRTTTPEPSRTTSAAAPSPTEPAPAEESGRSRILAAVDALRTVVATVASAGGLDDKDGRELANRLDEFAKRVTEAGEGEFSKQVKDLRKEVRQLESYVEELVDKDRLSQTGGALIGTAVQALEAAVQAANQEGIGPGGESGSYSGGDSGGNSGGDGDGDGGGGDD